MYCSWRGGPSCDPRTTDSIDLGLPPLYFWGRDATDEYEIIPPLLHYYSYSDIGDSSFNLWGPLLWEHDRDGEVFNIMPIYWHNWGDDEDHTTVFPFFWKLRDEKTYTTIIGPWMHQETEAGGEETPSHQN